GHVRWGPTSPTPGASMTCTATSASGAPTGPARTITPPARRKTRQGPGTARCAACAGAITVSAPGSAAAPFAATASRPAATSGLVFASCARSGRGAECASPRLLRRHTADELAQAGVLDAQHGLGDGQPAALAQV